MVLVENWPFFHLFFFRRYRPAKCVLRYSRTKKAFHGFKNRKFKKWKNWDICKGVKPMVLVENWPFFHLFFLGGICQQNVFYDILEGNNAFLNYKNSIFKTWKNCYFCEGVNPWFWSKIGSFSIFLFLSIIGEENVFYDILERKNAFLNYKNSIFKKWKNWDFCKGPNPWFWSKIGHFSIFFFRHYRAGKCVLRYSRTKKRFSRL